MGLVLLALGVLVYSLRREPPRPVPEPAPVPAAQATVRPPPPAPPGSPPRVGVSGAGRPAQTPVPTPPPAAPPPPEPAPAPEEPAEEEAPEDELESRREEARAAFEARLGQLAARRDALSERLRAWEASCGSSSSAVRPTGCVLLQEDVEELIAEIDAGLSESEREARRNWVQPGDRRSILEGHELDDRTWGALRQRAAAALR
jgi:hypothetical protein